MYEPGFTFCQDLNSLSQDFYQDQNIHLITKIIRTVENVITNRGLKPINLKQPRKSGLMHW